MGWATVQARVGTAGVPGGGGDDAALALPGCAGGGEGVTAAAWGGGGAADGVAPHDARPMIVVGDTPAATMAVNCAVMQAAITAVLLGGTPARMMGVARAVRQEVHRLDGTLHGVTAAAKLRVVVTVQIAAAAWGGGDAVGADAGGLGAACGGGLDRGGGGCVAPQLVKANSVVGETPAAMMALICALMQTARVVTSLGPTPLRMNGIASAVTQVVQAVPALAHGVTADAKLCVCDTGHDGVVFGGGDAMSGGGDAIGGGDGTGAPHPDSAAREAEETPALTMTLDWAMMHAAMMEGLLGDTPARMKGMARAVRQEVHALIGLAQGPTAALKFWGCDTGQVMADGGGDATGMTGGDGGGEEPQPASAASVVGDTPAVMMALIWALMHTPRVVLSLGLTPWRTNGVASAVAQEVQALIGLAHGVTAAAKFCVCDTGHDGVVGGGGGDAAGGGGDGVLQEARAARLVALTPAVRTATALLWMQSPSVTASEADTPATTKGPATAGRHWVQRAVNEGGEEQGVTAPAKALDGSVTGQVASAGSTSARRHTARCAMR
jgi:hypothetical protein